MSDTTPIQRLANAVRQLLTKHIAANTAESDANREAERDARVRETLAQLAREGSLPPRMSATPPPAVPSLPAAPTPPAGDAANPLGARDEAGADPAVTTWTPGADIHGAKHRLRIVGDNQMADSYSSEDVWVVRIDPPLDGPCPAWQAQIVLRDKPRTIGPWVSGDEVLVRTVDDEYFHLDLAKPRRQSLGWGLPTPDGKRFASVSGPGLKMTPLNMIETRTLRVLHTVDIRQLLKPLAYDPTGRALACRGESHLVLIDTLTGAIVEQMALTLQDAHMTHVSLPVKERLHLYSGEATLRVIPISWD